MTETQPGREPEQGSGPEREYAEGQEDRTGADNVPPNDDLHGQAAEVAESAEGPGPGITPGGG
jgi:hypothetical protein